ncbi:hypothetical protein ACIOHE_15855 [Streptomyces sp. NPDC087851]|uniref:hypothetical protein n=1 Tax=Streptomyces sp. NPDC087851 TaxID=3365810 RepID=UPI00380AD503
MTTTMSGPAEGEQEPERLLTTRGRAPWADRARPCRHCAIPTHLRDQEGEPAHHPRCTTNETSSP